MKTLFAVMLSVFSLLLQDAPIRQEQEKARQSISTEPKEVIADLKMGDRALEEVRGEIVFMPSAGNADDTLTGTLVFNISEAERKRIAEEMKMPLSNVPKTVKKGGVVTSFERDAQCPDLRFEFFARHKNLDVSQAELAFGEGTLQFQPFVLSFKESEQELSQMLCIWARQINAGRGRRGVWSAFTKALSGEGPKK